MFVVPSDCVSTPSLFTLSRLSSPPDTSTLPSQLVFWFKLTFPPDWLKIPSDVIVVVTAEEI